MGKVRFPATGKEFTPEQRVDCSTQIPTQVYLIELNQSETIADESKALVKAFATKFGEWKHDDKIITFGGKFISGTLDQAQIAWLLANDNGCINEAIGTSLMLHDESDSE
jgi:hypothetical protein